MSFRVPVAERAAYLAGDDVVDFEQSLVARTAAALAGAGLVETSRRCFEFVRDEVQHSSDHRRSPTTCRASEVLTAKTGFCYAKSHLLVALLRANGVPAGFCYQRLTVDGPTAPYCLHGLVALELPAFGWYAVDARGNKPGVQADFTPPDERLAFAIVHEGERDFPFVYPRPLPAVVRCLRSFDTWEAVLANLPDATELSAEV